MLFYISYASIPFIFLFQLLWLYQDKDDKKPTVTSFLVLNGLILSFCIPWLIFVALNYKAHFKVDFGSTEAPGSFWDILYGVAKDWALFPPLAISSIILIDSLATLFKE